MKNNNEITNQKAQSNIFSFNFAKHSCWQKDALMSALSTRCKLSTETDSMPDIVIGESILGRVKVDHLNSFVLQCAMKEGERKKLYFQPVFKLEYYRSYKAVNFFYLCLVFMIIG